MNNLSRTIKLLTQLLFVFAVSISCLDDEQVGKDLVKFTSATTKLDNNYFIYNHSASGHKFGPKVYTIGENDYKNSGVSYVYVGKYDDPKFGLMDAQYATMIDYKTANTFISRDTILGIVDAKFYMYVQKDVSGRTSTTRAVYPYDMPSEVSLYLLSESPRVQDSKEINSPIQVSKRIGKLSNFLPYTDFDALAYQGIQIDTNVFSTKQMLDFFYNQTYADYYKANINQDSIRYKIDKMFLNSGFKGFLLKSEKEGTVFALDRDKSFISFRLKTKNDTVTNVFRVRSDRTGLSTSQAPYENRIEKEALVLDPSKKMAYVKGFEAVEYDLVLDPSDAKIHNSENTVLSSARLWVPIDTAYSFSHGVPSNVGVYKNSKLYVTGAYKKDSAAYLFDFYSTLIDTTFTFDDLKLKVNEYYPNSVILDMGNIKSDVVYTTLK